MHTFRSVGCIFALVLSKRAYRTTIKLVHMVEVLCGR